MLYTSTDFAKHCSNPAHFTRDLNIDFLTDFAADAGSGSGRGSGSGSGSGNDNGDGSGDGSGNGNGRGGKSAVNFQRLWAKVRGGNPHVSPGASTSAGEDDGPNSDDVDETTSLGWYYSSALSNVLAKEFRALFKSDEGM